MLTGFMRTADQLADLFWAGLIDFRAVAGIGVAQTWGNFFNTGRTGLDTAARAMISRAVGAGDVPRANYLALQSIVLNSVISLLWIVVAVIFAEVLLRVLGASEELTDQALWYMRFRFIGSFPFMLTLVTSSALSAAGDTLTPARAQILNRALNISLMPFFVLGLLGLPKMGLAGTGFAFMIAQVPGTVLNLRALFTGTSRLHLRLADFRFDGQTIWRQVRLGAPASVTSMERSLAQLLVVGIVAPFGDLALAAFSLTQRLNNMVNLGQTGLGQATGVIVGQSLGAGKPARASETVRWALLLTLTLSLVLSTLMIAFPEGFLWVFTRDEELLSLSAGWLRIMAIGFLVGGLSTVLVQALNTAGDTLVPMIVTLATIWLVQQPAALVLSGQDWHLLGIGLHFGGVASLGSYGVAWAIVLAQGVRLFVYVPYWLSGRWMTRSVPT
jgi:putative MATE family efflux protein